MHALGGRRRVKQGHAHSQHGEDGSQSRYGKREGERRAGPRHRIGPLNGEHGAESSAHGEGRRRRQERNEREPRAVAPGKPKAAAGDWLLQSS
jgi:hypothetical protein